MAAMTAADYLLTFREGYAPADLDAFRKGMEDFLSGGEILVTKKTKKAEKITELRQ